ncbi:transposase [Candidatus Pacearchaeota archaeon]|nr:transposase [Candidatus Pacearchaeota archaeon]
MEQIQKTNWKQMDREQRGELLFKSVKIVKTPSGWRVPSQSLPNGKNYLIKYSKHKPKCNCPDCTIRKKKCKHIYAVEFFIKQEINEKGKIKQTKGIRITYGQKWSAYDKSQTNEKIAFMRLLKDLTNFVEQPTYKFGRPTLPMSEMVFNSVMKIYSTFSLRRFMSDSKIAKEFDLIDNVPCYSSIGHFLQKKELTPILINLIKTSASPLKDVETDFACDASGFSTSRFARWFDTKWGKEKKYRIWLKAHICSGVKTNIITSVEITEGHSNDSPQLSSLVRQTVEQFEVKEVSCDRAYSSRANLQLIADEGATPFIPFKSNVRGKRSSSSAWKKMYHYFMYKHDDFMEHYHKRSNVETVFHMIKTKFRNNLRSKTQTAQINELLCKILAHNICVVIQEVNELGLSSQFVVENC